MTELLERAIAEAMKLPVHEQDTLAALILEEIASDRQWEETFAGSQEALERLAEEALLENREGRTYALDPNKL